VVARGTLKQGSFEKDGDKVYTVDLNCGDFSILASAKTDMSDNDERDARTSEGSCEAQVNRKRGGESRPLSGSIFRTGRSEFVPDKLSDQALPLELPRARQTLEPDCSG
jgi:hypothetical protein